MDLNGNTLTSLCIFLPYTSLHSIFMCPPSVLVASNKGGHQPKVQCYKSTTVMWFIHAQAPVRSQSFVQHLAGHISPFSRLVRACGKDCFQWILATPNVRHPVGCSVHRGHGEEAASKCVRSHMFRALGFWLGGLSLECVLLRYSYTSVLHVWKGNVSQVTPALP
jgi:hypothetical protein